MQAGADPDIADDYDRTPLIAGSENGHANIVSNLLQAGADPNLADNNGRTPLMVASAKNHALIVAQLLYCPGIDINVNHVANDGTTALITASEGGHDSIVKLLLDNGANYEIVDKQDRTALSVAMQCGYSKVLELLQSMTGLQITVSEDFDQYNIDLFFDSDEDIDAEYDDNALNEAVTKAISEGSGNMKVSLIVLHGPPGSGKTSLKRLLLGIPPLPPHLQNSTPIVEQPARAITTSKVGLKDNSNTLEIINENKLLKLLAGHVKQQDTKVNTDSFASSVCTSRSVDISSQNITTPSNNVCASANAPVHVYNYDEIASVPVPAPPSLPVASGNHAPLSVQMTHVLLHVADTLKHYEGSSKSIFGMHWFHIIDSGGQPQFQDVLPLLFQIQSLHIVVIRLNERLDDQPKFRYIREGKEIECLPSRLTLTNFQIIERSCQLAQASCTSGNRQPPWVMVVGTHLDLIEECNETLEEKNERLKKLCEEYNNVLICKSQEEVIFSVNAMVEVGDRRQQYKDLLQKNVINAPTVHKSRVPLKWLVLEIELSRMSVDDNGIVAIDRCYEVAGTLGMTKEETDAALKYFTKVAIHLYYPKPLPHLLFTQMKPIVDRLSLLISTSFTQPCFGPDGDRRKLKQEGIFNVVYLDQLRNALGHLTNSDFLKLLQHLHIAVRISEEDYFLPCALSISDDGKGCKPSPFCDPLVFTWDGKIIPHSFFPTLVAILLQQKAFALPKKEEQKRHRVSLKCQKLPGGICLVDATHWIELYYYGNQKHCPALCAILKQSISRVCEILSLPHMATPRLGFICNGLICDASADRHICTLAEGTHEATCCESIYGTHSVDDDNRKLCWLDTTPTQRGKDTMHCDSHSHRICTCTVHVHIYTCIIHMYMYIS